MTTAYTTHEDYTRDDHRHLREIANMTDRMEVPNKDELHGALVYMNYAPLRLHLKEDVPLPQSPEAYAKWEEEIQWKLGEALGHYKLVPQACFGGDGALESHGEINNKLKALEGEDRKKERLRLECEELQKTHTVTFTVCTEAVNGNNRADREQQEQANQQARADLATFIEEVKDYRTTEAPRRPRGPAAIAERERLKATLKESLAHFDEVSIGGIPSETGVVAVDGTIELKAHLSPQRLEHMIRTSPHNRKTIDGADDKELARMESNALNSLEVWANDHFKHVLGKDLGNYGLVPLSGKFDKETRIFTYHVLDKERYGQILNDEGNIDPAKAFWNHGQRSDLEARTREGLDNYIADFTKAKELGLNKAAARDL